MSVVLTLFSSSRLKFDVKFYLLSIIFLIFDLEIIFLIPWTVSFFFLDFTGLLGIFFFIFILFLGFIY
jgi:NADH-quinone oxidoreductase subunit A